MAKLQLPTWIRESVLTSAKLGELYVDLEYLPEYLFKQCTHVVNRTGDEQFEVSLHGSFSLLRFGSRPLAFATSHQTDDLEYRDVAIVLPENRVYVTSNQFLAFRHRLAPEQDADQVRAFNFSGAVYQHPKMLRDFFDARKSIDDDELSQAAFFCAFGCVDEDQDIHVRDEFPFGYQELKLRVSALTCEFDGSTPDDSVFRLRIVGRQPASLNGASGGPVFAILERGSFSEVLFAGMIVRGGNEFLYIISAQTIRDFVEFHDRREK
ncbi:hypothetical protein [Marimonas arenosa]|uniref:Uncharacterized protein n=1 Tax=Marimonas arenosa TaxID=1795305 RepID=A0AAE3WCS4_9RHOB|nr:hypothetical protein [Marimonas arenosa]MDQ2089248.1 hypothetical protein [Marimonas arenosa]